MDNHTGGHWTLVDNHTHNGCPLRGAFGHLLTDALAKQIPLILWGGPGCLPHTLGGLGVFRPLAANRNCREASVPLSQPMPQILLVLRFSDSQILRFSSRTLPEVTFSIQYILSQLSSAETILRLSESMAEEKYTFHIYKLF